MNKMESLKEYNDKLSKRWNDSATESNTQLFFALGVDDKKAVLLFWDNAIGNDTLISTLEDVVAMMKRNRDKNFSTNNKNAN